MSLGSPYWLLGILVLPVVAWIIRRSRRESAFLYSSVQLVKGVTGLSRSKKDDVLRWLRWLALVSFLIALARPRTESGLESITASGVDIAVAMDLSSSMAAEDFQLQGKRVNRVEIAKDVLRQFIDRRPSDRIGIVAFAGLAYVASPLTLDHSFLMDNLDRLELNLIEDGTAIGSALGACLNRLRDLPSKSRIVILMTDGQNTAGNVPPLTAAEAAQALNVKVYTIGVGTRGTAPMPTTDPFGRKGYVRVPVNIDEDTLKAISEKTGGKYFRADNTDNLRAIYDEIDTLEKTEVKVRRYTVFEEYFVWAILGGLFFLLLEVILGHTVWRKLP